MVILETKNKTFILSHRPNLTGTYEMSDSTSLFETWLFIKNWGFKLNIIFAHEKDMTMTVRSVL